MEVYRDLLFSLGGGINCKDQMELQDDCATIAIGLGGTGIKCLKNLKRQVYDRVQPDNPDGSIPTYNKIKFLAVDWDRGSVAKDWKINQLDLEKEFFDLRIQKSITFGRFLSEVVLKNPSMYEWLKTSNPSTGERGISYLPSQLHSPESIRQLGRVLIIEKSKKFVEKIQRLILSVIEETKSSNSSVNIHVITGMGGATGSGVFLDTCYLIREAIRRVVPERKVTIFGYFFLPDVNLSIPEIQKEKIISNSIKMNCFAAMKELDYCMNFEDNGESWDQQYQGFHIGPSSKPPVDIPYLISGVHGMDNGFDHAMNIVSEFVLRSIIKNPIFNEEDIMGLKKLEMQHKVTSGVNRCYCGLEAGSIIIPVKKFITYVSSKLFKEISRIGGDIPSDDEIDGFAKNIGLKYEQLKKELLAGTSYQIPDFQFDYKLFLSMLPVRVTKTLPDAILRPIENFQEKMVGTLTKNMERLTTSWNWEMIYWQKESTSKVCLAYEELAMMVTDASKGPQYAAVVLNGSSRKNLVTHLKGELSQINEERENWQKNIDLRFNEMAMAQEHFLHPGMLEKLSRKKLFEEFMARVRNYYTDLGHIIMLDKMEEMINIMIPQFETLAKDCFDVYAQVTSDLINTFKLNYNILNDDRIKIDDSFNIPLVRLKDLQENLDSIVNAKNLETEIEKFHSNLFIQSNIWKNTDEKVISKEISNYLEKRFKLSIYEILLNYLNIYQNEISKKLEKYIQHLEKNSETDIKLGYCNIGAVSSILPLKIINRLKNQLKKEAKVIDGGNSYRISFISCPVRKAMADYEGIMDWRATYKKNYTIGRHIYERTKKDLRDWRSLFDLVPYSRDDQPTEWLKDQSRLYNQAVNLRIIKQNPENIYEYQIVTTPNYKELLEKIEETMKEQKLEKLISLKKEARLAIEKKQPQDLLTIGGDVLEGYECTVVKDYVMASNEKMKLIVEELDKREKLENAMSEIQQEIDRIKKEEIDKAIKLKKYEEDKQIYFHALMAGVIRFNGKVRIVYTKKDDEGKSYEIEMTNVKMHNFGGMVPIYHGFLTFSEFDKKDKEEIVKLTNLKKSKPKYVLDTIDQLWTIFTPEFVGTMQQLCRVFQPQEENKIKEFLRQFLKGLKEESKKLNR